jgi:hypothetical protein
MTLAFVAFPALESGGQVATNGNVAPVTFTKDIAPILQRACQGCHRPGSIAPMSLLTYEDVRPWAKSMKRRTGLGSTHPEVMPPWFIEKKVGIQQYKGDMSLSDGEIAKIARWADSDAPRGNPADMPPPLEFADASKWQIGTPDLILSTPSVEMAPTAPDWWGPIGEMPTGLTEDRYVAAVEMKEVNDITGGKTERQTIGALYIFHHLSYKMLAADGRTEGDGFGWPVHEVGRNAEVFDPDAGKLLKAGTVISLSSAHLHSNGRQSKARVEFGFKFHPKGYVPKKRLQSLLAATSDLDIRGMQANQRFEGFFVLPEHTKMVQFEPHMHASGVRMCLEAIWGSTVETLSCAGYNHSWVRIYTYAEGAEPLLPKGTILRVTGYFDNTPANKNVADPRNWQGLGHRSTDNMMVNIGKGIHLTDAEFQRELDQRRQQLRITEGQTVPGCPLCSYSKKSVAALTSTSQP